MLPLLLAVALSTQGFVPLTAARVEPSAPARILVVFRTTPALPAPLASATQEVERVWRDAGMTFEWTTTLRPGQLLDEPAADRVIVVIVTDTPTDGTHIPPDALGAVPIAAGRMRQLIYVSPSAVKALLAAAGVAAADSRFPSLYARTVGRVVAHELGHLLLRSAGHRRAGLMRRTFAAVDVLSTDEARFAVGGTDLRLVQQRLAGRGHDAPAEITTLAQALPPKPR